MISNIQNSTDPSRIVLEGTVLVAHQPQFMPWLGFFNKAAMGDVYLIHDTDQFKKKTFENRNKIRIQNPPGWTWITAPVSGKSEILNISEVKFSNTNWQNKALKTIELSYRKAPYFDNYFGIIEKIFKFNDDSLRDFNINAIKIFFDLLEIKVPVYRSSELIRQGYVLKGQSTDAVISMCKWFNAKIFVAGVMGKTYLEKDKFEKNGIQLVFQKFIHPIYQQMHGDFIPYMTIVDLLFNHGSESREILGKSNYEF
jgi:hypothetical protein